MTSIKDVSNAVESIHQRLEERSRQRGEELADTILNKLGVGRTNKGASQNNKGFAMFDPRFIKKED